MPLEVILTVTSSGVLAATGVVYLLKLLRESGSDLRADPARVEALLRSAPYARLDNALSKRAPSPARQT